MYKNILIVLILILLSTLIYAHGGEHEETTVAYQQPIPYFNNMEVIVLYASIVFLTLIFISIFFKKHLKEKHKKILFTIIALLTILITAYLVIGSIYLNTISETKGPIHWHADYEVWICDKEINIIDAKPPLNRVGTPTLHGHGDNRIHIEGVVVNKNDVSLGAFFHAIGGKLSEDEIIIPTNDGLVTKNNNDLCNNKPGKLYVFVNGDLIKNHSSYIIKPYETVPPGDTIKIIFSEKEINEINSYIKTYGIERRL